jgi:beta-xylosidase
MDARAQRSVTDTAGSAAGGEAGGAAGIWRDPSRGVDERVADLLARMTAEEKLAQLAGIWLRDQRDHDVAPLDNPSGDGREPLDELIRDGIGHLTRVFGTRPIEPAAGIRELAGLQRQVMASSRFAIPAIAHEECLTGLETWRATAFPTPLAWGASFDPDTVAEMAAAIAGSMRQLGVHQGLAPLMDVARDARWGRVEETIGEDPYLVGSVGSAYVRGLESAGIVATLKHFAGYPASRAGRNFAPVSMGTREFTDVILPPFEMAIRAGARSVMSAYTDIDGIPVTGDAALLTGLLRGELGFDGVVVSDYDGIVHLEGQHGVAESAADAGALALAAGVDIELPHVLCYGMPLAGLVRAGRVPADLIDRAAERVLRQKCQLGMLDPGWSPGPSATPGGQEPAGAASIDLDPPAHRALARRLAEESVILLANDGALPLPEGNRVALVGPLADDPLAFFGCYTFPRHLGYGYPSAGTGIEVTTVLDAFRAEMPSATVSHARGCDVRSTDRSGIAEAGRVAASADVVVAVLGDEAGLFGRGSSGEGCDAVELTLPGVQEELLAALADSGTPVVLVLITGRPYALGHLTSRLAAVVQAFFPGEEGGAAITGVLSGRVTPSGRLPVEVPRSVAGQPSPYLRTRLAARTRVSSADPTPLFAFGHGLSYTSFSYADLEIRPDGSGTAGAGAADDAAVSVPTDAAVEIGCTVRNTGSRPGTEVVQLYLNDPVAQVARPLRWLAGFARVPLEAGQARRVTFRVHADRTAFSGRSGDRVVEPGEIGVEMGRSSADLPLCGRFTLIGKERVAGADRVLTTPVSVQDR